MYYWSSNIFFLHSSTSSCIPPGMLTALWRPLISTTAKPSCPVLQADPFHDFYVLNQKRGNFCSTGSLFRNDIGLLKGYVLEERGKPLKWEWRVQVWGGGGKEEFKQKLLNGSLINILTPGPWEHCGAQIKFVFRKKKKDRKESKGG